MKKIAIHRIVAVFMVIVLSASSICVFTSAVGFDLTPDTTSVQLWSAAVNTPTNAVISAVAAYFDCPATVQDAFWHLMNMAVGKTGPQSLDYMNDLVGRYNQIFNAQYQSNIFSTIFNNSGVILTQTFAFCFLNSPFLDFELAKAPSGLLRIREIHSGRWVVDSSGGYPYCEGGSMAPTSGGNQWVGERSCSTAKVNMKNLDTLNLLCNKIKESGTPAEIRLLGNYKAIWWNRQYYCDPEGRPFVCYANEGQAAINQPRPDTSVTDEEGNPVKDESGTVINNPNNSTNIDLSGMTITLPNGNVQIADSVIYDESTKTYYIDSHDTYNTYVTYNYSWTFYINYTSITYIGQTAEYDKYYEVYYELPDGRDSADLTAEDLEQIDFNIDVVNYGRSADDTSLRALYHFDGDTRDSSYWNYCSDFKWTNGASLTYMDSGVFGGALYLSAEEWHNFEFLFPSNIGRGDFTMQFRLYQSYTPTPQSDTSGIRFLTSSGWKMVLTMDGSTVSSPLNSSVSVRYATGQWNEFCVQRLNGVFYYFLNGVLFGSVADNTFYYSRSWWGFSSSQQTYKYLDEFRLVSKALYGGANYTPTSVPYDTNLSLVLPDSAVPVADEYWSFDQTISPVWSYDFTNSTYPAFQNYTGQRYVAFMGSAGTFQQNDGYFTLLPRGGAASPASFQYIGTNGDDAWPSYFCESNDVTWSLVDTSGNIYSLTHPAGSGSVSLETNWGRMETSGRTLSIFPNTGQALNLVYVEFVKGSIANTGHKFVTKVVPVAGFDKPTLAVRTDIPIAGRQIGGARPSLPVKGLVWAMVEGGVIRSLQIYNGSAWEGCDGRIFTGTRWVPYSGYNIITLKDFYDVADASGDSYEYIYSESGFWNWWQKSWNAFTSKLFAALGSAGFDVSGGTNPDGTSKSLWQRIKDAFNDTLGALIETLFGLVKEVLKALLSLVTDMLSFFFGFLTDTVLNAVKAFFSAFSDNSLFDFFKQPPVVGPDGTEIDGGYGLPSEVGTAFAFISGVIMVLPSDLRSILFFGLAVMVLFGVFKLVKS